MSSPEQNKADDHGNPSSHIGVVKEAMPPLKPPSDDSPVVASRPQPQSQPQPLAPHVPPAAAAPQAAAASPIPRGDEAEYMTLEQVDAAKAAADRAVVAAQAAVDECVTRKAGLLREAAANGPEGRAVREAAANAADEAFAAAKRKYIAGRVEYGGVTEQEAANEIHEVVSTPKRSRISATESLRQAYAAMEEARGVIAQAHLRSTECCKLLAAVGEELGGLEANVERATAEAQRLAKVAATWRDATALVREINSEAEDYRLRIPRHSTGFAIDLFAALHAVYRKVQQLEREKNALQRDLAPILAERAAVERTRQLQNWTCVCESAGWSGRRAHAAVVLPNGDIVVMGGGRDEDDMDNDVWRSGDGGATWTRVGESAGWSKRVCHAVVVLPNGDIVVMGGFDGHVSSASAERTVTVAELRGHHKQGDLWLAIHGNVYDVSDFMDEHPGGEEVLLDTYVDSTDEFEDIGHSEGALEQMKSMLVGTLNRHPPSSNDVWKSGDGGATWTCVCESAGWSERGAHAAVVLPNGDIVVMGGASDQYYCGNDVWKSADGGATWTLVCESAGWSKRAGHAAVVMPNGDIVVMGGAASNCGDHYASDVWKSGDGGATWTCVCEHADWSAREGPAAVVLPHGEIVVMGGLGADSPNKDVWKSDDGGATWTSVCESAMWSAELAVVLPRGDIVAMGRCSASNGDVWKSGDEPVVGEGAGAGAGAGVGAGACVAATSY